MVFQAREDPVGVLVREFASSDYDYVQAAQYVLVAAKTLANESLDAIALHCPADLLAWDRQAQTRRIAAASPGQNSECFATGFVRILKYAVVIPNIQEAHAPLESQTRARA